MFDEIYCEEYNSYEGVSVFRCMWFYQHLWVIKFSKTSDCFCVKTSYSMVSVIIKLCEWHVLRINFCFWGNLKVHAINEETSKQTKWFGFHCERKKNYAHAVRQHFGWNIPSNAHRMDGKYSRSVVCHPKIPWFMEMTRLSHRFLASIESVPL